MGPTGPRLPGEVDSTGRIDVKLRPAMLGGSLGRRALMLALSLIWVLGPGLAFAQSEEEIAGARSAATEGVKAFREQRYNEALDLFRRAESVVHAPTHLLYMARAHRNLGQLVAARELYNKVVREKLGSGASQAFLDAQKQAGMEIREVEPLLAKLTVRVKLPGGGQPVVKMDEKEVASALVGVPMPVDPGTHRVEVAAEGYLPKATDIELEEGASESISVSLEPDPDYVPSAQPAQTDPEAVQATEPTGPADAGVEAGGGLTIPAYAALGVGALGLGAGVLFTVQSASKRSDADDKFRACQANGAGGECKVEDPLSDDIKRLDKDAGDLETSAIVGYAIGGVGIAAGVALLLLDASGPSSASEPSLSPYVGYHTVGVSGSF